MFGILLFLLAIVCAVLHIANSEQKAPFSRMEVVLSYVLLINVGVMSLLAAYMHIYEGPTTAKMIGWLPDSPFQFEMGVTNLSFGVLGVISYWIRGHFWDAVVLGFSILMLGCFVGHLHEYFENDNISPYNMGPIIWFNDLFLPIFLLVSLIYLRAFSKSSIS